MPRHRPSPKCCTTSSTKVRKKKNEPPDPDPELEAFQSHKPRSSKTYIRYLSEVLAESWQDLGLKLGFTHAQMDQLKSSCNDDEGFCAQVMLNDWQNIAKEFLKQPAEHICVALREMGQGSIAETVSKRAGTDSAILDLGYSMKSMTCEIHKISFRSTPTVPSKPPLAIHLSNCQTVMIGASNTIVGGVEEETKQTDIPKEEGPEQTAMRTLEMIIELYPAESLGINLQKLESEFKKALLSQGIVNQTFHSFTGRKLVKFLTYHGDKFEVSVSGCKSYVRKTDKYLMPKASSIEHTHTVSTKREIAYKESSNEPLADFFSDDECRTYSEEYEETLTSKSNDTNSSDVKTYASVVGSINKNPSPRKEQTSPCVHAVTSPASAHLKQYLDKTNVYSDPRDLLSFVKDFTSGHYVLLICIKDRIKYLDFLALVPWLAVFDFDERSRDVGLLSILEERIKKLRAVYTCTWKDPARFSDYCTEWCLIRGSVQEADSRTPQTCRSWYKTVREKLDIHLERLAAFTDTYTTVKCLLILPDDEETLRCMMKTVSTLDAFVEPAPTIIVCDPQKMPPSAYHWIFQAINIDFLLRCSVQDLCKALSKTSLADDLKKLKTSYRLPTADETNNPGFDESIASVLREDLEVLYLDCSSNRPVDLDKLKEEGDKFLKGGTLRWFAFYECDAGHYDAERDIMESIVKRVKEKFLEPFRSGVIKLYHAPGSGGTTLMQRVLWELRKSSPCAQVKLHSTMSVQNLAHNLEALYEKTHLPLILLIDGGEDKLTKELTRLLNHVTVVILQVKRYPHRISKDELRDNMFFLKGEVSVREATKLGMKFLMKCDSHDKEEALHDLVEDVHHGLSRSVYEFGLTTFLDEYRGIASYVRGYLQLELNRTKSLEPWQDILGYLSLAYFYGQTSMPYQFFASMLGKPLNYDVTFEDFPHFVQALIVPCDSEGRKNNVRICHYVIARGILDQILTWPMKYVESETQVGLSMPAKSKLVHFAYRFIEESKKKTSRTLDKSNTIIDTLTRTFLHRDYRDVGEGETVRKRPLSTLLEDIHCYAPFTDRIKVIEKLAMTFPENPNFCAHLGRIYTICKPDEDEIAQKCFDKALDLCKKKTKGTRTDDIDEGMKRTMMHIYHMYGMHYLRRIAKYTGRLGETPKVKTMRENYEERVKYIMEMAEAAFRQFTKLREITPLGSEEGYGYIDEITVRLQVCCFISKFFSKETNFGSFLAKEGETSTGKFVKESITEIAELFMECYSAVDAGELDRDFYRNVNMYNLLFKNDAPVLNYTTHTEDISTRCFKAAVIKLKYGKNDKFGVLEMITSKEDIEDIVKMCEQSFDEIQATGVTDKRRMLELCYRDWIQAVRHNRFPSNYSQDDVLLRVRQWGSLLRSPMSKFYLFCMLSIIGIGTSDAGGNVDHLQEAGEVREELQNLKVHFPKPRLAREWFGKGDGIRALIPGSGFFGNIEERNVKGESNTSKLAILTGTICRPNLRRQTGYIDLDLGETFNSIRVFFVPVRTVEKLIGQAYAGERVEFALGFTAANGYEAYNVARLKKIECTECDGYAEIKSDEMYTICRRCNKRLNQEVLTP